MAIQQIMAAQKIAAGGGTPHTYWRIYVTANQGGGAYTALGELELRATVGGADQCGAGTGGAQGTATADSEYSAAYRAINAFSDLTTDTWASQPGADHWLRYQAPTPISVAQVAMTSHSSYSDGAEMPKDFLIQSSDNGSSWTTEKTVTNAVWTSGQTKLYSIP